MISQPQLARYGGSGSVARGGIIRMTEGDLRARPVVHHQREAIEAQLTVVFAALAVRRHLQDATGTTIGSYRPCAGTVRNPV